MNANRMYWHYLGLGFHFILFSLFIYSHQLDLPLAFSAQCRAKAIFLFAQKQRTLLLTLFYI